MTKAEYLRSEARRIGVPVSWFKANHLTPAPCDHRPTSNGKVVGSCMTPGCVGWVLVHCG